MYEDLIFDLRFHQNWRSDQILNRAADALEAMQAELTMRRKSGSASDRLHNLCEGIAADADGSEWSREEWERLDAENATLRAENERLREACASGWGEPALVNILRAEVEALRAAPTLTDEQIDAISRVTAPVADASMRYVERQGLWERTFARAVIAADRALRGEKA